MPHLPADYAFASADSLAIARALDDFRRGHPLLAETEESAVLAVPAEALSRQQFEALALLGECALLVPQGFAQRLALGSQNGDIRLTAKPETLHALVADAQDAQNAPPRAATERMESTMASEAESALLQFAKRGGVLPLLASVRLEKPLPAKARSLLDSWQVVRLSASMFAQRHVPVPADLVTTPLSTLPLAAYEGAKGFAFRLRQEAQWHLAVIFGEPEKATAPLVRIHSSCLTGDLLGSLRCDCGNQLHSALKQMSESDGGVLLYMSQEGRGIGIGNKIRAYHLQDGGMDTREANESLGFDADARDYALAAMVLKSLKLPPVRLMTNNPRKVDALVQHRIAVRERVPLKVEPGEHNHRYLQAKAQKLGHLFES